MENGSKKSFRLYFEILAGKRKPKFQSAKENGLLDIRINQIQKILENCSLCERNCQVNRLRGETGFCNAGTNWPIFAAHTNTQEELEFMPSATLFMSGCTMRCSYCIDAPQSYLLELGQLWTEEKGAQWIDNAFIQGCKNIQFVGGEPTVYLYNILKCLKHCQSDIPVIWNSNSYYSRQTAEILKDIIDIYLLDFRYFNDQCALKLSGTENYTNTVKRNMLAAKKYSELLIRILILPNHTNCDAKPAVNWIKNNLGEDTRVNLMCNYSPLWQAGKFPEINRPLMPKEYEDVANYAKSIGLKNLILCSGM